MALRSAIPRLLAALSEGVELTTRANLCGAVGNCAINRTPPFLPQRCVFSPIWFETHQRCFVVGFVGENRLQLRRAGAPKLVVACLSTDDPVVQVR